MRLDDPRLWVLVCRAEMWAEALERGQRQQLQKEVVAEPADEDTSAFLDPAGPSVFDCADATDQAPPLATPQTEGRRSVMEHLREAVARVASRLSRSAA